tara:strand:- start:40 stop:573 length:534 start_codon:yes stop_codon:yes gene_type:complete
MTALTDQMLIAFQEGEKKGKQLKIATDSRGGNQWDDMSGYGSDWPGTMKDQMKDEPGTDPAEIFEQLELPLDTVKRLKELMIAGDPSFTVGGSKGSSRNQKIIRSGDANAPNAKEFMEKLQLGPAMFPIKKAEVDYSKNMPQGYKDWSKQLQKIMGTKGGKNFIEDLMIHSRNYPKA